ncbi:hypothetical protein [Mycobacterium sp.]|uniref:hypothetical protein n=1 Tax=Mycobacterium sp. TaxID=1785 RepID=UPI0031DBCAEF
MARTLSAQPTWVLQICYWTVATDQTFLAATRPRIGRLLAAALLSLEERVVFVADALQVTLYPAPADHRTG